MAFDVVEFYPSISIDLLRAALDFASINTNISDDERNIIIQAKCSLLYNNGEPWCKRKASNIFDVTMGSYDGAESCKLVGTFLLNTQKRRRTHAAPITLPFVFKESFFPLQQHSTSPGFYPAQISSCYHCCFTSLTCIDPSSQVTKAFHRFLII